jgi:cell division protease FtsH
MSETDDRTSQPRIRRLIAGRRVWALVAALLVVNWLVASAIREGGNDAPRVSYSEFRESVQDGTVAEVTSMGDTIRGELRKPSGGTTAFETRRPEFAHDSLLELLERHDVVVKADREPEPPVWRTVLVAFGPALVLVGLLALMMRRVVPTGLLRSRARRYEPTDERTTFEDVAGIEEAEDELAEIVGYLRDPDRYQRLGAVIPRGVLLSGPPGTGKTLLARAVAGEAGVPFYSLSASEFVEMVVGVGARRVRDLFKQAKESAPAIIFIDELDAIGRMRGGTLGGAAHDEREQTLNQILTELDGFSGSEGVIVIAASNRPEILDVALLRPGRFDRRIVVAPPDRAGRARILAVHTRDVPLGEVELDGIAGSTPGMVGAELKNLVNEAALNAARRGADSLESADFDRALERIVLGAERRITIPDVERARTAYHEAGHALLGMLEPGADPVRRVSIVPRGESLGTTFQRADADRYGYDTGYLRSRIVVALGGRAAEDRSSRPSPARWSDAGGCRAVWVLSRCSHGSQQDCERPSRTPAPRRRRRSSSTTRSGNSSTSATPPRSSACGATARGWRAWRRSCSSERRSTRQRRGGLRGSGPDLHGHKMLDRSADMHMVVVADRTRFARNFRVFRPRLVLSRQAVGVLSNGHS